MQQPQGNHHYFSIFYSTYVILAMSGNHTPHVQTIRTLLEYEQLLHRRLVQLNLHTSVTTLHRAECALHDSQNAQIKNLEQEAGKELNKITERFNTLQTLVKGQHFQLRCEFSNSLSSARGF